MSTNLDYIYIEEFSVFITVRKGVIYKAPKSNDGTPDLTKEQEVKAPSAHFVESINDKLGSGFRMDDFCGH